MAPTKLRRVEPPKWTSLKVVRRPVDHAAHRLKSDEFRCRGGKPQNVSNMLSGMFDKGQVSKMTHGVYCLPVQGNSEVSEDEKEKFTNYIEFPLEGL